MINSVRTAAQTVFLTSAAALLYAYLGYPVLLVVLRRVRPRPVYPINDTPTVSVVITAHNEEDALAATLENTLALDYPADRVEIIVASDCSTDRTDEIALSFAPRGVRLCRQSQRLGKTAAQNGAVAHAVGEIVLFSDATTLLARDALRAIVPSFGDPTVGCVSGRVAYRDVTQSTVGQGTRSYWNYEFFLKEHESAINSLIGVCGCLYAVRRSAYVPLYHDACSDFVIATKMVEQGLRAVYVPAAVCVEDTNDRATKEMRGRVRIIAQTLSDLWRNRSMLNPLRTGLYAVQLISHKLVRYLVPLFLVMVLGSSTILAGKSRLYGLALGTQILFYATAISTLILGRFGVNSRFLALPQYFLITNVAVVIAAYKFMRGTRYTSWEPMRSNATSAESETRADAAAREAHPLNAQVAS